jgi:hypothetical protein
VKLFAWIALASAAYMGVMVMGFSAALSGSSALASQPTSAMHVGDIPPSYFALYRDAATASGLDWTILAAIGSVETDHGRSSSQGVHSGVNANGCCAGPMQFSVVGRPSTWDSYGAGGNVYDPTDAIPAAARYLKASGAPGDYHAAILSYNHSETYYAAVMGKARAYRDAAPVVESGKVDAGPIEGGSWLATVPGTGIQCDRRIVPNVVTILARYHAHLTACYAPTGHASDGEHPLGLAVDLVPQPPSTWAQMERLARDSGWRESCATSGCAGQTHTAFRFVGYNGYPGHGDPSYAGTNAHLHLSWNWSGDHGPPAASVQLVAGD